MEREPERRAERITEGQSFRFDEKNYANAVTIVAREKSSLPPEPLDPKTVSLTELLRIEEIRHEDAFLSSTTPEETVTHMRSLYDALSSLEQAGGSKRDILSNIREEFPNLVKCRRLLEQTRWGQRLYTALMTE